MTSQREQLLNLSFKVLETSILSKYELKSYENYEHLKICLANLENIGKAYNVADNTSTLLKLEKIPNLKSLFLDENFDFSTALKIRNLNNPKYFRKWINEVSESTNAEEISSEYLKEIKGKSKYFDSTQGKFLRSLTMFGIGAALGTVLKDPLSTTMGFALSMLDTFWIEKILKGKNPSMFIDSIRMELEQKNTLNKFK